MGAQRVKSHEVTFEDIDRLRESEQQYDNKGYDSSNTGIPIVRTLIEKASDDVDNNCYYQGPKNSAQH